MTRDAGRRGDVRIEALRDNAIAGALADVARLRLAVFRAWPYLYDGTLAQEADYIAEFARAKDAVIIAARADGVIVGAATAAPLAGHSAAFVPLFEAAGFDPDRVFYCGESVLLEAWRGRGLGHAFFDHREAHARACRSPKGGYLHAAFCAVVRAHDDPRRPADYVALDAFWRRRGYAPIDGLLGSYDWQEIGEMQETAKPLQFWMKALT